jgi:FAD binding domain
LYEQAQLPDRLVMLGDAACGFNPTYGQGMSVAIVEAVALGNALATALAPAADGPAPRQQGASGLAARRASLSGVSQAFMRDMRVILDVPWAMASATDAPYLPGYKRPLLEAAVGDYLEEVSCCCWLLAAGCWLLAAGCQGGVMTLCHCAGGALSWCSGAKFGEPPLHGYVCMARDVTCADALHAVLAGCIVLCTSGMQLQHVWAASWCCACWCLTSSIRVAPTVECRCD